MVPCQLGYGCQRLCGDKVICVKCGDSHRSPDCPRFPYEPTHVEEYTNQDQLDLILAAISRLEDKVDKIESTIQAVIPELKPTVDALTNSPIFRMMTGIKR